uniref:ATP synthase subunit b n=1 Tax=uncultured bacterium pSY1435 TaxID=561717 RepID=C4N425_9BACT|nr:ATP synthase F0 B subunit [uncultured bacterium pSY1435]
MTVDWKLVLFELINFGVLVLLLGRFVFRPVKRTLEQRRADIAEREQQTSAREQAAAQLREHYEVALRRIEQSSNERVEAALSEAKTRAEALIDEAREHARERALAAEVELAAGRRRALEQFRVEVMSLATEAAGRVIREIGAPEVGHAFTRRGLYALEDALDGPFDGPIDLFVSPELNPVDIEALVLEMMPGVRQLHVAHDPALIGGVRLIAAGHEIQSSAGASLDAWNRRLIEADEQTRRAEP